MLGASYHTDGTTPDSQQLSSEVSDEADMYTCTEFITCLCKIIVTTSTGTVEQALICLKLVMG